MLFFISFKYSLITIIKSKIFLLLSLATLSFLFILNLSYGLYIRISEKEMSNIFVLDYINVVTLLMYLTVISVFFSIDFFHAQKKNGIKTMEVKNGMKIWEIFFSKTLALIATLFSLSLLVTTIVVIENLIIFNENIYVTKLVFVNLYLIFLVPLFLLTLDIFILSLNWNKVALIISGLFLGLLSPFWLVNALLYDFVDYKSENRGTNELGYSEYGVYFNYHIDKYKKSNDSENQFVKELSKFGEDQLNISKIVYFENEIVDDDLKEYYQDFIKNSGFYRSGNLFYNIDLFNFFNQNFLKESKNYVLLKYDGELVNSSILFKELFQFDIKKTDLNLYERRAASNWFSNIASVLKELKFYIKQLEKIFYSNSDLKIYYDDLKKVNNFVLEMYQKGFYFRNDHFFLSNSVGSVGEKVQKFFKDPFGEPPIGEKSNYTEQIKEMFKIQKNSSAKSVYQSILFYIINNYNGDKLQSNKNRPSRSTPTPLQMVNYYISPFLWLEHFTKYGLVPKNYGNIVAINSSSFVQTNNMFEVDFSIVKGKETSTEFLEIKDYIYKGPNTILLVFLIILYSLIILVIYYIFYRLNFYK